MSSAAVPARYQRYEEGHGFRSTNRASFGKGTASAVPLERNKNAALAP